MRSTVLNARSLVVFGAAFCMLFPAVAQVAFTGTWRADNVAFAPWTFVFRADSKTVTGTVSQGSDSAVPIVDGAIEGNHISFTVPVPRSAGSTTVFTGVLNGDVISFTRENRWPQCANPGLTGALGLSCALSFTAKLGPAEAPSASQAPAASPGAAVLTAASTGTRVVFLGTGGPSPDPDRSGPAVAIVSGGKTYLVDAGAGVVRRAASAAATTGLTELSPSRLSTLFLTHLHSDHTVGYPDLIFTPAVIGRGGKPLEVYGPKGTQDMTNSILAAWKKDMDVRLNGLEHGNPNGYKVNVHEIAPGQVYKDVNVTVKAFLVKHGSWDEAFGYRFDGANRSIVISGDTSPTPAIADACNGCDVLVHEVYCGPTAASGTYRAAFHTSAAELAEIAKQARPKLLVLYHQGLQECSGAPALIEQVQTGYAGTVVAAKDLDVF